MISSNRKFGDGLSVERELLMSDWTLKDTLIVIFLGLAGWFVISYWKPIVWTLLIIIFLLAGFCFLYRKEIKRIWNLEWQAHLERRRARQQAREERLRLERLKPRSLNVERIFSIQSPANFVVQYGLRLLIEAPNESAGENARRGEKSAQAALAEEYDRDVFQKVLRENSYRFHLGWKQKTGGQVEEVIFAKADAFSEKEAKTFFRRVPAMELQEKLRTLSLTKNDCRITATEVLQNLFPDELIERNYAMLSKEQKEEIERDERYSAFDERLAVAALKRRLDFLGNNTQKHEMEGVSVETTGAGRRLKIKWRFKENAPSGYELVGFRKFGGFHPDEWDETQNGTMIIHSHADDEMVEPLDEGKPNFYTLFLRTWNPGADGRRLKRSPLRFQITLATADETAAIEATIRRIEEKKTVDPSREFITKALKELNLSVEYHESMDDMKNLLKEKVRRKKLPAEEEERQMEIIDDLVSTTRLKYEV